MDKNFEIKVTGNWCEYQPEKHIDLSQIISFVCWTDQIGGPYRFQLKAGDTFYIERYEIGKQIENALKAQQTDLNALQKRVDAALSLINNFEANSRDTDCLGELLNGVEQALKGGES